MTTTKLSLTIAPKPNALDNLTLYEPNDILILDKLINSSLLKQSFNNKLSGVIYENEKQQLEKYKDLWTEGRAKIFYKRPNGMPYGRSNPISALGMFPIRREIRHTLCKKNWYDFDVKNCHPTMLLQICRVFNIPCERLYLYVLKRQEHFDLITAVYGCSEEQAKNLFIIYLYGGSLNCWIMKNNIKISLIQKELLHDGIIDEIQDLIELRNELTNINKFITEANPNLRDCVIDLKKKQGKYDYNLCGSVVSFFLQEYEIRILECIYLYCIEKEYIKNEECILCADGLMLQKSLVGENSTELCMEFHNLIKSTIGFDLTFTQKDMTQDYLDILDKSILKTRIFDIDVFHNILALNYEPSTETLDNLNTKLTALRATGVSNSKIEKPILEAIEAEEEVIHKKKEKVIYLKRKEYFEEFHFKVMKPICYGRKSINSFDFISQGSFLETYRNLKFQFPKRWLDDDKIKSYENTDFLPTPLDCSRKTFNLFNGFIADELILKCPTDLTYDNAVLGKRCEIFIKHLWYLCGKNNQCLEYALNYQAHAIQYTGQLPRTAMLYKSDQGTGKNIYWENFAKKVMGDNYLLSTAELDNVIGRFPQISQKIFVVLDEANGKDTFSGNDKIKSFITAEKVVFEKKGIDGIPISNFGRMIFLTNNEYGVKIEQSDRRFAVFECSNDMKNNTEYMKALVNAFNTPHLVRDFYLFLKTRDISKFDTTNDRPITQLYKEMQTATRPLEQKYFCDISTDDTETTEKTGKDHYLDFKYWCATKRYKPPSELSFLKRLNDSNKYPFISKEKRRDNQYYIINHAKLNIFIDANSLEYKEETYDIFPSIYSA